jgi:hypothetical protein
MRRLTPLAETSTITPLPPPLFLCAQMRKIGARTQYNDDHVPADLDPTDRGAESAVGTPVDAALPATGMSADLIFD